MDGGISAIFELF